MKKPTKQRGQWGGPRPGSGRPPKKNPRTSTFSIAVSAGELDLLRGVEAGKWARDALLKIARRKV